MHSVKAKGILSAAGGLNVYRGCTHGCIYCDSRSRCYRMDHAFEDVEVKENALELLEDALRRKREKCMIGTGSMSDPYMPPENRLRYTRGLLELADRYGFGVTLITKSDLVLRDLDLLKSINARSRAVVQMTLTTFDEELCKKLEPNVCTTARRFEVLKVLRDEGIPTVVWLCPILPFLNDTEENLRGILRYCEEAKVRGVLNFGMGLTLREGNREYFYAALDREFPGLRGRYEASFGLDYQITSENDKALRKIFYAECIRNGILCDVKEIFAYLNEFPKRAQQMSLLEQI